MSVCLLFYKALSSITSLTDQDIIIQGIVVYRKYITTFC